MTAIKANIRGGFTVRGDLIRFVANVSKLAKGYDVAVASCFGGNVAVIESTTRIVGSDPRTGAKTIEAFGLVRPKTHTVTAAALDETLEELGLEKVSANVYMNGDDDIWNVEANGDSVTIQRDSKDDVASLLTASLQRQQKQDRPVFESVIAAADRGAVAYIREDGEMEIAFLVGPVRGEDRLVQVLALTSIDEPADVIDVFQVVAHDDLEHLKTPEDFGGATASDYYRGLYAQDPTVCDTLDQFAK